MVILTYYAGIMLTALRGLLCSKQCWQNVLVPTKGRAMQLVLKERKVYEDSISRYCQKHSECVWAKIIEQELSRSECLLETCLPSSNKCVMHDAKRGGEGEKTMTSK